MYGRFSSPVLPGEALTVKVWRTGDGEAVFQTEGGDGRVVLDKGTCTFDLVIDEKLESVISEVIARNQGETEFHQSVREVLESLGPVVAKHPEFLDHKVIERICEPERQIIFRVPWQDDRGEFQINRGMRVEFNSALGPFKGGLRFHPSVNLGIVKFLGFEQIFKNALTGMPIGGGKGGSDFDPKGRSEGEVMRFCQSFMTELYRHLGEYTDVPAGDIGVGTREIGFLFGQYKRITNRYESGVLTGKGLQWGGALVRTEATGYGAVLFAQEMLRARGEGLDGRTCIVSGSGNVAIYAIEKVHQLGGTVVACSDSSGIVHDPGGIDLDLLKQVKEVERGRVRDYAERRSVRHVHRARATSGRSRATWRSRRRPRTSSPAVTPRRWSATAAWPCPRGRTCPPRPKPSTSSTRRASPSLPARQPTPGGVATSALEMQQNASRDSWTFAYTEDRLAEIMRSIHDTCFATAEEYGAPGDYVMGANIAGFLKVATAMDALGLV